MRGVGLDELVGVDVLHRARRGGRGLGCGSGHGRHPVLSPTAALSSGRRERCARRCGCEG